MAPFLHRPLRLCLWLFLGLLLTLLWSSGGSFIPVSAQSLPPLYQAGETAYEQGDYGAAIASWERLLETTQDANHQVTLLNNLSLAYQKLQNWPDAEQTIRQSLEILGWDGTTGATSPRQSSLALARSLDIYGQWQERQGQTDAAILTWQQAEQHYRRHLYQTDGLSRFIHNQLYQAKGLQYLGRQMEAQQRLEILYHSLKTHPQTLDFSTQVDLAIELGRTLRLIGTLDSATGQDNLSARQVLQEVQPQATAQATDRRSALYLELGNTYRAIAERNLAIQDVAAARDSRDNAIAAYEQAAATALSTLDQLQAQLNQLSFQAKHLIQATPLAPNPSNLAALIQQIYPQLLNLSNRDRAGIAARIHFVHHLTPLLQTHSNLLPSRADLAHLISTAVTDAQRQEDRRFYSNAIGTLGRLYETATPTPQHLTDAFRATDVALKAAIDSHRPELTYRWLWQLGKIQEKQGERERAIVAYTAAVKTIESIRRDLVILNPDVQFSFRDDIEPVYRELADLLLKAEVPQQDRLKEARQVIDSLQTLEVENYLRQACRTASLEIIDRVIDKLDPHAAFLYSIILDNRLELVLKLPGQADLVHQRSLSASTDVQQVIQAFRRSAESQRRDNNARRERNQSSHQLYTWLIQPLIPALTAGQVETLVLVSDGNLKSIPISALWTGNHYLIEDYAIATTPSLQLLGPEEPDVSPLRSFVAGSSLSSSQSPSLPHVEQEILGIQALSQVSTVLSNETFTSIALAAGIETSSYPVVHIATHGVFSSNLEQTYILAGDHQRIGLNQLSAVLRARKEGKPQPIDLLFLSACQTAQGDSRAGLGIAGVAIQSGARSTIASLWSIRDRFSADLALQFYQAWIIYPGITKAKALQSAQIESLKRSRTAQPVYWAAHILVGNWL